jgi:hypothetical protein
VVLEQPATPDRRSEVARSCATALRLTMPCVVDDIDNRVDNAYAAWPERLFVVDAGGRIAFASGPGPWGFNPARLAEWLNEHVGKRR